jgi:hypothetical protein
MFVIVAFGSWPLFLFDALNTDGVEVGQLADVLAHLPRLDVLGPSFIYRGFVSKLEDQERLASSVPSSTVALL